MFDDIELEGRGDSIERITIPPEAVAIAQVEYRGDRYFGLTSLAADGSSNDLLVNTVGAYEGTVLFDLNEHSAALEVSATGPWSIVIRHISKADRWDPSTTLGGGTDMVVVVDPSITAFYAARIQHIGDGYFGVFGYGERNSLLVNEVGDYEGEVIIPSGTIVLEINASPGTFWTIEPSD
jgi:hypothetical protein